MSARETLPPRRGERVGALRERAAAIIEALRTSYPDARCALRYDTPFQLLVATILSAQCTDARVNEVTPALFEAYPDAAAMATAPLDELECLVQPTGFFRQKARHLHGTAQRIMDDFTGVMPETVDELATLPGAARKTANVVVSNCFPEHAAGIAVDTHVQRTARRMGITRAWEPPRIEAELMRVLDRSTWNDVTHLMIDHGRAVCRAPRPRCEECPIIVARLCPSAARWTAAARQ